MSAFIHTVIGFLLNPPTTNRLSSRGERGLSQSTENALLLAGAVAVAAIVVTAVTAYVTGKMNGLK